MVMPVNRRPVANRSWTTSIASHRPGSRANGSATRGAAVAFFRVRWRSESPFPDKSARPSCNSPATRPVIAVPRYEGTHAVAWSRQSLASSLAVRCRPVGDCDTAGCAIQRHDPTHSPLTQPIACHQQRGDGPFRFRPYQFFAVITFSAWISSACSATICFNRRFSFSN